MSKRMINYFLGLLSLFFGFLLYLLFRENAHISKFLGQIITLDYIRSSVAAWGCNFTKYYLPDFLWAFSLSCLLQAVSPPSVKNTVICCFTGVMYGSIWELLQWLGIINGTGDWLDVIMYFSGSSLSLLINFKEK